MSNIPNISKFSFPEMFSDSSSGKTSGTAFCGVTICLVGTLCFLLGCIDKMWINKSIDIITQSITFVLIGASLMGLRRVAGNKPVKQDLEEENNTNSGDDGSSSNEDKPDEMIKS